MVNGEELRFPRKSVPWEDNSVSSGFGTDGMAPAKLNLLRNCRTWFTSESFQGVDRSIKNLSKAIESSCGKEGEVFKSSMKGLIVLLLCSFLMPHAIMSTAVDSIDTTHFIRDGETIVSASEIFEFGFFSPGVTTKRYLGIWYKKSVETVVWVANREVPLNDSSGVVKVMNRGNLVLMNGKGITIWSSHRLRLVHSPVAELLDSGNLVVKDDRDKSFIWQSFDHPCDTLLPGMKLGKDLVTDQYRYLSSWKSSDDPAPGNFTFGFVPDLVSKEGSSVQYRSNENEVYDGYIHGLRHSSILTRLVISHNGDLSHFKWTDQNQHWVHHRSTQEDSCDSYGYCGANGVCNPNNSPVCACLDGFVPKNKTELDKRPGSGGCIRKTQLSCSGDVFKELPGVMFPDSASDFNNTINLEECESQCSKNCSCTAYANSDIGYGGSGCQLWFGELIDIKQSPGRGQLIYIRLAMSEIDETRKGTDKTSEKRRMWIVVSCGCLTVVAIAGISLVIFVWRKKKPRKGSMKGLPESSYKYENQDGDLELPLFDFATIALATDNFSPSNKIGEGGFGSVYKGILDDGLEIAVKRLSKGSTQGDIEFRNEVEQIAKVQHRNLVKLLGCCIQKDEKALIYEFMPNKSLDFFIFDQVRSMLLDWPMRVVGTYGYMSPEYVIDGVYSTKSDIFSFGVLLLEIVSGKRNRGFFHPDHHFNLVGHAWKLFTEDRGKAAFLALIINFNFSFH
ncbi:hypothetical protein V6N12_026506 [Hibiscus sabdariffa]|uniref:Receptor-like serine/threonine-protein kinase n=1 Tax=Hibiscus sabdariffa TaxID=183260 RepID=A0ABR2DRZ0_9ROSI